MGFGAERGLLVAVGGEKRHTGKLILGVIEGTAIIVRVARGVRVRFFVRVGGGVYVTLNTFRLSPSLCHAVAPLRGIKDCILSGKRVTISRASSGFVWLSSQKDSHSA